MKLRISDARGVVVLAVSLWVIGSLSQWTAAAQQILVTKVVAEKKLKQLPAGPIFWQVEIFPTLAQARTAASDTSLDAEVAGKVWLFTLGPMGSTRGGIRVAEIGPVPPITAAEYLMCINYASVPPGFTIAVHTHLGSEAFYVLAGRLGLKTPHGVRQVSVGQSMSGYAADTPIEVFNSGMSELNALIMFVRDAAESCSSAGMSE